MVLATLSACAMPAPVPDASSVAGLRPSGTVTLQEALVSGAEAGRGTLHFRGRNYQFRMVGSVMGPGGAAAIRGRGAVYNLSRIEDFGGIYTQGAGGIGLDTSRREDLWLQNRAGVVIHVRGEREGAVLSLGRSEMLVEILP